MRRQKEQVFEEEENDELLNEEEEDVLDDGYDQDEADKDAIIEHQKKMIRDMRKQFASTIDTMRQQLNEIVDESTEIQTDMLKRIKELKKELEFYKKGAKKTTSAGVTGIPRRSTTGMRSNEVRASLYDDGPKHPRKLAPQNKREPMRL